MLRAAIGSGIFFLGYCISMVPSNLIIVRLGGPLWLGIIICAWGVVGAATAAIKTPCEQPCEQHAMWALERAPCTSGP